MYLNARFMFLSLVCFAYIIIFGDITEITTFYMSNNPYQIFGTVRVLDGVNLTIESGFTMFFYAKFPFANRRNIIFYQWLKHNGCNAYQLSIFANWTHQLDNITLTDNALNLIRFIKGGRLASKNSEKFWLSLSTISKVYC